jgi:hypothetical protein
LQATAVSNSPKLKHISSRKAQRVMNAISGIISWTQSKSA